MASGDSGNGRGCPGVTKSSSKVSIICLVPVCPWCCCWSPWTPRRCPPPVRGPFFCPGRVSDVSRCYHRSFPQPTALSLPFVVSLSNHERSLYPFPSFDKLRTNGTLMHCAQPCVQIIRSEVLSLMPGDRRKSVVQIELRKPRPIAQPFELLAVQLVGEIDYAFSSVVELQPNLVVTEIPRIHHMTRHMLVLGHLPGPPGWLVTRTPSLHSPVTLL